MNFGRFTNLNSAHDALDRIEQVHEEYGYVTISDIRDIVKSGIKPRTDEDNDLGWSELFIPYIYYDFITNAWRINLCDPIKLDKYSIFMQRKSRRA